MAEFRADWATAVKTYQSAYAEIARVPFGPEHPMQRAFEVAAVAEQIHIKVGVLSLTGCSISFGPILHQCCMRTEFLKSESQGYRQLSSEERQLADYNAC